MRDVLQPAGRRPSKPHAAFESLVRWWSQASNAERFRLCVAAQAQDPHAPRLELVLAAALEAERAAGTIGEG